MSFPNCECQTCTLQRAALDLLALAKRTEIVINELARLGRCSIILRALAVDIRTAIAKAEGRSMTKGKGT